MSEKIKLRKSIQTAMIIAIMLVLRNFSYMVSFGGGGGMRLSLSVFFSRIPPILFGPVYGGITSGVCDILGEIIKPEGAYIPLLTVTAVMGGVLSGLLFKYMSRVNTKKVGCILYITVIIIFLIAVLNFYLINKKLLWGNYLLSLGKRTGYFSYGLLLLSLLILSIPALDWTVKKFFDSHNDKFIILFIALLIANVLVTTINTYILMIFIPSLSKLGFFVFYIPRLIEEIIVTVLQSIFINYVLKIYNKIFSL